MTSIPRTGREMLPGPCFFPAELFESQRMEFRPIGVPLQDPRAVGGFCGPSAPPPYPRPGRRPAPRPVSRAGTPPPPSRCRRTGPTTHPPERGPRRAARAPSRAGATPSFPRPDFGSPSSHGASGIVRLEGNQTPPGRLVGSSRCARIPPRASSARRAPFWCSGSPECSLTASAPPRGDEPTTRPRSPNTTIV